MKASGKGRKSSFPGVRDDMRGEFIMDIAGLLSESGEKKVMSSPKKKEKVKNVRSNYNTKEERCVYLCLIPAFLGICLCAFALMCFAAFAILTEATDLS